jgi:hypothetical protein
VCRQSSEIHKSLVPPVLFLRNETRVDDLIATDLHRFLASIQIRVDLISQVVRRHHASGRHATDLRGASGGGGQDQRDRGGSAVIQEFTKVHAFYDGILNYFRR